MLLVRISYFTVVEWQPYFFCCLITALWNDVESDSSTHTQQKKTFSLAKWSSPMIRKRKVMSPRRLVMSSSLLIHMSADGYKAAPRHHGGAAAKGRPSLWHLWPPHQGIDRLFWGAARFSTVPSTGYNMLMSGSHYDHDWQSLTSWACPSIFIFYIMVMVEGPLTTVKEK